MDQRQVDATLQRHMTRLRSLAFAFCTTLVVYVFVAWLLIERLAFEGILELPFVVTTSVAVAQLGVVLAGYLISRAIRNAAPAPTATGAPVDTAAHHDAEEAMQRYTRSVILASALREVAATVGFVLTLLTGEMLWVLLLSALAMISMLVHWPRRDAVQDFLQQQRVPR